MSTTMDDISFNSFTTTRKVHLLEDLACVKEYPLLVLLAFFPL